MVVLTWYTYLEGSFLIFLPWLAAPSGPGPPHYRGCTITMRHATPGMTPLGEGSARRRDIFLTTHNTQKRQTTSSLPAGFESAVPASKRPQTHALNCAVVGIVFYVYMLLKIVFSNFASWWGTLFFTPSLRIGDIGRHIAIGIRIAGVLPQ